MRVMVMAIGKTSGGKPRKRPTPEMMAAFQKYDQALKAAGVVVGEGRLHPAEKGKRVEFDGEGRAVTDGPFAEAKEVVGGYWLWQVASMDEALEWLKKAPYDGGTFEVRPIMEPTDF